jgi:antitoxin VapB
MVQKERSAMTLNVKDPEAHRLAQAIAKATGETMTRVVTEALRERYQRIQKGDPETLAADLRAIAKRAAAHVKRPYLDHAELLYDERGLPK